ncbi:LANO_0G17634g1_1 [Lachancea nothofagi CBS 11611]|uniref:LANO_0G17634g1_1 n=1 Tax=Lachancea nothofagi CBS 11611 TaxID=1266666 RepID=A0A1G4KKI0_9SACH|nr:LANO_0G17634g1_1 [Lachancea nothofagi CBS 11611]
MQSSPVTRAKKPRGTSGGRKPSFQPPKTQRAAQIRAAQQTFRERRQNKLQELQDKEKLLELALREIRILKKRESVFRAKLRGLMTVSAFQEFKKGIFDIDVSEMRPEENEPVFEVQLEKILYEQFSRDLYIICGGQKCKMPAFSTSGPTEGTPSPNNSLCYSSIFENDLFNQINELDAIFHDDLSERLDLDFGRAASPLLSKLPERASNVDLKLTEIWQHVKRHPSYPNLNMKEFSRVLSTRATCQRGDVSVSTSDLDKCLDRI